MFLRYVTAFIFVFLLSAGCKKGDTPTPTPPPTPTPTEEQLSITLDPDPGSTTAAATGATYAFKIAVTKAPSAGVKVDVATKKNSDNSAVSDGTKTIDPYTPGSEISIGGLTAGTLYDVSVTVTSKSKSTNNASAAFKVARK
ncbi:MAG: hypothetical protein ACK5EZ_09510 [Bacteroidota bacterium]|nr:hypothetical protein [Chitinophagaceae bacterium]